MAAPSSTQLTSAGYSLSNGVYSQTFGSIVVSFTISDEPSGGLLAINLNGDTSASDAANAAASVGKLGYQAASAFAGNAGLGGAGGQTYYGQSL